MADAQQWLDNNYPTKTEKKIEGTKKSLEGELIISNFPNLEKVILSNNEITKLIFQNCPQIKEVNVYANKITKLEIEGLVQLEYLHCGNNQLNELNVGKNKKLKTLFYLNDPLESQLEKLQGIENLTELEWFCGKGIIKKVKEEIKIHLDAMKRMDDFYRQNPPSEETALANILQKIGNDYLSASRENKQKEQENKELKEIINSFEKLFVRPDEDVFLPEKISNKHEQLEQLKTNIRNRLDRNFHDTLEDILENQKALVQSNFDNSFIQNQLERFKQRLLVSGQMNQTELNEICQVQAELSFLEFKLEQEQKFQAQIEINI